MADDEKTKPRLEIAHVLFIDIVEYSKLLTNEHSEALQELNQRTGCCSDHRQACSESDNAHLIVPRRAEEC